MNTTLETLSPSDSDNNINSNFDDINGNWADVQEYFETKVRGGFDSQENLYNLIESNSRSAQQALFGGYVQYADSEQTRSVISSPTRGGTVARAFWWGFHVQISNEDVNTIVNVADGATTVLDFLLAVAPPAIKPFLAAVRIFVTLSKEVLRAVNRGRGVYISMSWFAPGLFVPTAV